MPVIHTALDKKIGWVFIGFKESLLTDIYTNKRGDSIHKYFLVDHKGRGLPVKPTAEMVSSLDIGDEITPRR